MPLNYATKRLRAAAETIRAELSLWGSDTLATMNLTAALEELDDAAFYFDAHGATQKPEED